MRRRLLFLSVFLAVALFVAPSGRTQSAAPFVSATTVPDSSLIQPEAFAQMLKTTEKDKLLVLQVGSRVMFGQAHIPGSEYAGPGSQPAGIQSLEAKVASLPKDKQIVLYCGCCPWDRCPNIGPAWKRLHELGFTSVRVVYFAHNFGDDWVSKGYPSVKGG